jgi:hypothetical protein
MLRNAMPSSPGEILKPVSKHFLISGPIPKSDLLQTRLLRVPDFTPPNQRTPCSKRCRASPAAQGFARPHRSALQWGLQIPGPNGQAPSEADQQAGEPRRNQFATRAAAGRLWQGYGLTFLSSKKILAGSLKSRVSRKSG